MGFVVDMAPIDHSLLFWKLLLVRSIPFNPKFGVGRSVEVFILFQIILPVLPGTCLGPTRCKLGP